MTVADLASRFDLKRSSRNWRGACPACGYAGAFVLSMGRGGWPVGWCASCQDQTGIAAALKSEAPAVQLGKRAKDGSKSEGACRIRKRAAVVRLWDASQRDIAKTLAGRYLVKRRLSSLIGSPALRFHPACPHPESTPRPALIALVQDVAGAIVGVHRTYLAPDGTKAKIEPAKASLGPVWGGVIRLQEPNDGPLIVSEGIETSASAGLLAGFPAWAAISAGNLEKAAQLPSRVGDVVIAEDPDPPGVRAAAGAKVRWMREGRTVRIMRPTGPASFDFNDVWLNRRADDAR